MASRFGFELRKRPRHYAASADQFLRTVVRVDDPVVIDVGANEGQSVTRFTKIWPNASIHCFEPSRAAFARLRDRYSSDRNLHLNEIALSSRSGSGTLNVMSQRTDLSSLEAFNEKSQWFSQRASDSDLLKPQVPVDTFDNYWANQGSKISFMKIDTQGHERDVIEGAKTVLASPVLRPTAIEVEINIGNAYGRKTALWEVDKPLSDCGYFAAYLKRPFNLLADPHQQIDVIYVHPELIQD